MKIKSISEFNEQAPVNATHVLKLGDKYEYANFTGYKYDSCDNSDFNDVSKNHTGANNDWFFNVSKYEWQVHLELCEFRGLK